MLKTGIITAYPEEDWHSRQLIKAAAAKSEVAVIDPRELTVIVEKGGIGVFSGNRDLREIDGFILTRAIHDDGSPDYQVEVYRALRVLGRKVINDIEAAVISMDKFRSNFLFGMAGLPAPRVVVTQSAADAEAAILEMGEAVLKPIYGSLGEGLIRLHAGDIDTEMLERLLKRDGVVYLQKYVDNPGRDIRAFVIGEKVVAAIYRQAGEGEWVTNIHRRGRAVACELSREMTELSLAAARVVGLDFTGVDIMETDDGPVLIEVNGVPHWQGVYRATGRDIATMIVDHLIRVIESAWERR